jgi:hypothetical protein
MNSEAVYGLIGIAVCLAVGGLYWLGHAINMRVRRK